MKILPTCLQEIIVVVVLRGRLLGAVQPLHVLEAPLPLAVPQRLVPEDLLHDDHVGPARLGQRLQVGVVHVGVGQVVPEVRERPYQPAAALSPFQSFAAYGILN